MEEKNQIFVVVTHNSVHVVKKVFVGCNIVCVVGADHVLYDVSDERHLLVWSCWKEDKKMKENKKREKGSPACQERQREDRQLRVEGGWGRPPQEPRPSGH